MNARRAIWRWGLRLLRKEWREQLLVIVLITMGVALSLLFSLFVFHSEPPEQRNGSTFFVDGEPAQVDRFVAALGDDVTPFEQGNAQLAGSGEGIRLQAVDGQEPGHDPFIDLVDGSLPSGPTEVAITDGTRDLALVDIGGTITLDGVGLTVAGIVENPIDLRDEFVLLDHRNPAPFTTTPYYRSRLDTLVLEERAQTQGYEVGLAGESTASPPITIFTNIVTGLAMLLIGLLASASFGVVARRRVRQYGLLGALGASPRLLKGAAAANGFAVGALALIIGGAIGCLGALALLPRLENAVGNRIDFSVPLSVLIPTALIVVIVSTFAAWWPARSVATQPVVEALAARRPKSRPVRNTTALGLVFSVVGYVLLGWAATEQEAIPALIAVALAVVGVLLLGPAIIAIIGRLVSRAPLPLRIAGRDLARFQGRAAAALGAIVMALAIPVGIGVATASNDAKNSTKVPNLPADTAIAWAPGVGSVDSGVIRIPTSHTPESAESAIENIRGALPDLTATPIRALVDPGQKPDNFDGLSVWRSETVGRSYDCATQPNGDSSRFGGEGQPETCLLSSSIWVADPGLAALWGLDVDPAESGLLVRGEEPVYREDRSEDGPPPPEEGTRSVAIPDYGAFPQALIPEGALDPALTPVTAGWILSAPAPLTPDQITTLRSEVGAGVAVTPTTPGSRSTTRLISAALGLLVGLSILGTTVALILGESADQARTLQVLGAKGKVRRGVAGATAALLAAGGALLAVPLGYLVWVIMRADKSIEAPFAVPWLTFAIVFVAFPLIAAAVAALIAGGSGRRIARRPGQ